jgi:hypothetical protein
LTVVNDQAVEDLADGVRDTVLKELSKQTSTHKSVAEAARQHVLDEMNYIDRRPVNTARSTSLF